MSGVLCALAGASLPVPPLSCSVGFNSMPGSGPDVSGASGNIYTTLNGSGGVAISSISGGSGVYTMGTITLVQEATTGGGTVSLGPVPNDPTGHLTVYWDSLPVGQSIVFHLHIEVQDSDGRTASNDSSSYLVHRVS